MHDVTVFLQRWSPHVWLAFSLAGALMSGALTIQAWKRRKALFLHRQPQVVPRFWFRHAVSFLFMHTGYVVVGIVAILKVQADWANLLVLGFLLATPLMLFFRSYDSLRLSYLQRKERER